MTYRIYSYEERKSDNLAEFNDFSTKKILNEKKSDLEEFQIQAAQKKISFFRGEIFKIENKKYFIFHKKKINFLFDQKSKRKIFHLSSVSAEYNSILKFWFYIIYLFVIFSDFPSICIWEMSP